MTGEAPLKDISLDPIHERIKHRAQALKTGPATRPHLIPELPPGDEVSDLFNAAIEELARAAPHSFEFRGKTYYMRAGAWLILDVYATGESNEPLATTAVKVERLGHMTPDRSLGKAKAT